MADVITRGDKGSSLTYAQGDANLELNKYNADATATVTLTQAMNRTFQNYTGTAAGTWSLPDASGLTCDTEDWFVTIKNSSNYTLTIDLTDSADKLDGNLDGSLSLAPNQVVTIAWDGDSTGGGAFHSISHANVAPNRNYVINGNFDVWQRGTSSSTVTAGSENFLADRIYANCAGANCTQAQSTSTPDSNSRYSLELVGASSVTTVEIATRLEAADVAEMIGTVTLQCQIYNETGGAFTPDILINTPTAEDDWAGENAVLTATALQSCSNAAWTQVTYTVDISGYTDVTNGIEFVLQVPTGNMTTTSDKVRFSRLKVESGSVATEFTTAGANIAEELAICKRYYEKSYDINVAPGTSSNNGSCSFVGSNFGTTQGANVRFSVHKRTTPTISIYSETGVSGGVTNADGSDPSGVTVANTGTTGIRGITLSVGPTTGHRFFYHWTADSEL